MNVLTNNSEIAINLNDAIANIEAGGRGVVSATGFGHQLQFNPELLGQSYELIRSGDDLIVRLADGTELVIEDYYLQAPQTDVVREPVDALLDAEAAAPSIETAANQAAAVEGEAGWAVAAGAGALALGGLALALSGGDEDETPLVVRSPVVGQTQEGETIKLNVFQGVEPGSKSGKLTANLPNTMPDGMSVQGGEIIFDANHETYDALADGKSAEVSVDFTVSDETGAQVRQKATFTVTGTNDAPSVSAALSGSVEEDATIMVNLLDGAADVDEGAKLSVKTGKLPAGASVDADGVLSFDASDAAYQSLAEGATKDVKIDYQVVDEKGATVDQSVTITVTGTNDAPSVSAALSGSVDEDATIMVNLLDGAADVDDGAKLSVKTGKLPAGASVDADGVLSFDASDAAYQSLAEGATKDVKIDYQVVDEKGATVDQSVTITVTGTNDAPVATPKFTTIKEDATFQLDLSTLISDIDTGSELEIVDLPSNLPAGFSINGNVLSFDGTHKDYQILSDGSKSPVLFFTYRVTDENGAKSNTAFLNFQIEGVNDTPTITNAQLTTTEGGTPVSVDLTKMASDVDLDNIASLSLEYSVSEQPSKGSAEIKDGKLVFSENGDFDYLAKGETKTVTVKVKATDDHDAAAEGTVSITVTGTNDAPTTKSEEKVEKSVDEGSKLTLDLLAAVSDTDANDKLTVKLADGVKLPAGFSLDKGGTSLIVNANHADYDALEEDKEFVFEFTYTVTDPSGESTDVTTAITIDGKNDPPSLKATTLHYTENGEAVSLDLSTLADDPNDNDDASTLTYSIKTDPDKGDAVIEGSVLTFDGGRDFDSLDEGDEETVDIVVKAEDQDGASIETTYKVDVTGVNDAPVAGPVIKKSMLEDGKLSIDLTKGITDADEDAELKIVSDSIKVVSATGNFPKNENFTIQDEDGENATIAIRRASIGTNEEQATAGFKAAHITRFLNFYENEDGDFERLNSNLPGKLPTVRGLYFEGLEPFNDYFVLDEDGKTLNIELTRTVTVDEEQTTPEGTPILVEKEETRNSGLHALGEGESITIVYTYDVVDEKGLKTQQTATITIEGEDDAATFEDSTLELEAGEYGEYFLGYKVSDVDDNTYQLEYLIDEDFELPEGVSLGTSKSGYDLLPNLLVDSDHEEYLALKGDESKTIEIPYQIKNRDGTLVDKTATIVINGLNNAPEINDTSIEVAEDQKLGVDLAKFITDVDTELDQIEITIDEQPVWGKATLEGTVLTFDTNGAFDHLEVGDQSKVEVKIKVSDGEATSTGTVKVTVNGEFDETDETAPQFRVEPGELTEGGSLPSTYFSNEAATAYWISTDLTVTSKETLDQVAISDNDSQWNSVAKADEGFKWEDTNTGLGVGDYQLYIVDEAGNFTEAGITQTVTTPPDTTPPRVGKDPSTDGIYFVNEPSTVYWIPTTAEIFNTTDIEAFIDSNPSNLWSSETDVNAESVIRFSATRDDLAEVEYTLYAVDDAGNMTAPGFTETVDRTPPQIERDPLTQVYTANEEATAYWVNSVYDLQDAENLSLIVRFNHDSEWNAVENAQDGFAWTDTNAGLRFDKTYNLVVVDTAGNFTRTDFSEINSDHV